MLRFRESASNVTIGHPKAPVHTQADTMSDSSAYMVSHLTNNQLKVKENNSAPCLHYIAFD